MPLHRLSLPCAGGMARFNSSNLVFPVRKGRFVRRPRPQTEDLQPESYDREERVSRTEKAPILPARAPFP